MLEARACESEVIKAVLQRDAGHRDAQAVHLGEVGQPYATGLVHLAKDHVALLAMQGAPSANAPLEGAANAGWQLWMAAHQLLEHRHRP
jgi:hypothetical protein